MIRLKNGLHLVDDEFSDMKAKGKINDSPQERVSILSRR